MCRPSCQGPVTITMCVVLAAIILNEKTLRMTSSRWHWMLAVWWTVTTIWLCVFYHKLRSYTLYIHQNRGNKVPSVQNSPKLNLTCPRCSKRRLLPWMTLIQKNLLVIISFFGWRDWKFPWKAVSNCFRSPAAYWDEAVLWRYKGKDRCGNSWIKEPLVLWLH